MTGSDDPLTPQEEEVRRLLAEARHAGSTPPEVVARLDSVLDDLTREPERAAPVVDLARRRRRAASLLVAAAAVVAVGVGVNQVVTPEPQGEASSAGDTGGESGAAQSESQPGSQPGSQPKGQSGEAPAESSQDAPLNGAPFFAVRRDHLADDLTDARSRRLSSFSSKANSADRAAGVLCSADAWGRGRFVAVRYGDQPAVVVFRRPANETQVADLFLCGSEQPVRSVTLPAP